jgi:flagellar hook protein FlgE
MIMGGAALFTAVTGLQSFQRKLDVIASNIANVNTTGYRSSRVLFEDLFSQTIKGGAAPDGNFAGSNPQQIGLGVRIGSIDVDFGQGAITATGVTSDLAIQGQGFFILNDGAGNTYTRDGSFGVNRAGFLIDPSNGLFVQGYQADLNGNVDTDQVVTNLNIPVGGRSIVQATSLTELRGNLTSEGVLADALAVPPVLATTVTRTLRVFDSQGTGLDVVTTFTKIAQVDDGGTLYNAWDFQADFGPDDVTFGATGTIIFNDDGSFRDIGTRAGGPPEVFTSLAAGTPTVTVPIASFPGPSIPSTPFEFSIDFTQVTELSGDSELTNPSQDGFARGVLQEFSIGDNGQIIGVFTNGLTQVLGQVALADFANVNGLAQIGSNQFRETPSSGFAEIGVANTGSRGSLNGGVLESSNVDLGTEFSNMIVTQRAFQANARTINAADTLLQETVNLIR